MKNKYRSNTASLYVCVSGSSRPLLVAVVEQSEPVRMLNLMKSILELLILI